MKRNNIVVLLLLALFSLLFFSCKSTPKAVDTPAPAAPQGASKASLDALNAAAAKAEAARTRASDFDSSEYFPSDWQDTEDQYNKAKSMPRGSDADAQKATDAFNNVATAYDDVFEKAIPMYAQAREDEILAVRKEIIDSGFSSLFPEFLENADNTALKAYAQYNDDKDYYGAKDTAAEALKMYNTQNTMASALTARTDILDNDFITFDPDNFEKAEEAAEAAAVAYEGNDLTASQDSAEEALLRYNLVLNAGWASIIDDLAVEVAGDRQRAIELKANVAAKDIFNDAETQYKQAVDLRNDEKYGESAKVYRKAKIQFVRAGRTAEEKRGIAEDKIKEAEEKIAASDENARQAEIALEGDAE